MVKWFLAFYKRVDTEKFNPVLNQECGFSLLCEVFSVLVA